MFRKLLIMTLIVSLLLPSLAFANQNAEITIIEKCSVVEKIIYGNEQTGALVDRVNKLEKDLLGTETKDALVVKLDRAYTYSKENISGAPSLITKLNTVEWTLNHAITNNQAAMERLEAMERTMLGNVVTGSIHDRLNKLMKLALASGWPEVSAVTLAKDTLVKITLTSDLHTKSSRPGDVVTFVTSEDVYTDGLLVVAKGARGYGKVLKVEESKNFGRDAKMEVSFDNITTIDGILVATFMGEKAKEETKSLTKAAGATFAGLVLLGPVGVVGGAFVHGKDVSIPAGTEVYIQISSDAEVSGIKVK